MNVALDANVLIKDPWFRLQISWALLDYLAKTPWWLVISEVVEAEVCAYQRWQLADAARRVESSLPNARRLRVEGLPAFDAERTAEKTMEIWEERWRESLSAASVCRLGVRAEDAAEAARRAAEREAPCSERGEGVRDAMIWLSLDALDGEVLGNTGGLAFVSENTRDFAASDKRSLRRELLDDVRRRGSRLTYYVSLDDFLRKQAEPIGHVTREWVLSRLDLGRLEELVCERLRSGLVFNAWQITDHDRRRIYEIVGEPEATTVDLRLEDFYVWQFDDGHAELRMTFGARTEAPIECLNLPNQYFSELTGMPYFEEVDDDENPVVLELECLAELVVEASARIEGEGLSEPTLEDANRL